MENFLAEMTYSHYPQIQICSTKTPFNPKLLKSRPDIRNPAGNKHIHRIGNEFFWLEFPESSISKFLQAWNSLPPRGRSEYNWSCMCLSPNLKDRRKQEAFFKASFGAAALIFIEIFSQLSAYFWSDFNIPASEKYWNQYVESCLFPTP